MTDKAAPRRRALAVGVAAFVVLGAVFALLRTGSAGPVAVAAPEVTGTTAQRTCERFIAALPTRLDDLRARATTPSSPWTAAYGDPAVVIRCGAPLSGAFRTGDQLFQVNDVAWYPEERGDVVVWSLPTSAVNVEVTIPDDYTGGLLALLAEPVRRSQPL